MIFAAALIITAAIFAVAHSLDGVAKAIRDPDGAKEPDNG